MIYLKKYKCCTKVLSMTTETLSLIASSSGLQSPDVELMFDVCSEPL